MTDPYDRAHALVGTRFRPLGRNPEFGLDCVGLAVLAYELSSLQLPPYRLGEGSWEQIERWLLRLHFERSVKHKRNALLVIELPASFHFGVCGERTIVHADMRFKRVVETPITWACESAQSFYLPGDS